MKDRYQRRSEQGGALIYILIAIALLALLTITFMDSSSQQTQSQNTFKLASEIESQGDFIRSAVQECVLSFSSGDGKAVADGVQLNNPYPLMPDNVYLNNCAADGAEAAGSNFVSALRCPGNNPGPPGAATEACHADIFAGSSGKFLPPPPAMFGLWHYYSGADGVFLWTETEKSDSFIQTALQKLDEKYSECEADVIDATGGAIDLDSGNTVSCPDGSTCFRIRMIIKPSSVYNGDTDGQEAGCP